jgi:hypothetical protein
LFKTSIRHQSLTNSKIALFFGLLLTLLSLACSSPHENSQSQRSRAVKPHINAQPIAIPSEREALQKLCEESSSRTNNISFTEEDLRSGDRRAWQQAAKGIENTRKLLPLAKELTIAAFREHAANFHLDNSDLEQVERYIQAVNSIELDESLDNVAEVDDAEPQKISIGPGYALNLTADEEAIMLLGHELTHVAAWSERLSPFIESAAQKARQVAGVSTAEDQKEDLACDYIGTQALKQFIRLRPTKESAAQRLSIPLGGCEDSTEGDLSDDEHLSEGDTLRAMLGLDPDLKKMILRN